MKRFLLATILGALVAFIWGYVSWEILSWHKMANFKNPEAVSELILENAPTHDLYMLPAPRAEGPNVEAITEGPFIYAVVRPDSLPTQWSMPTQLLRSFCIQLSGSLIISIMIFRIRARRYISRASIGLMMGLFAGLTMALPSWNWFEIPNSHAIAAALDPLIAWTLSGMLIAAIIQPKKTRRIFT
ncbi:MAG: hypothetical protein ACSHX0_11460 [Akkermansiaceae bacterium]